MCQHVLNDKELFSKHCPALLNDEKKIFNNQSIEKETEKLFAAVVSDKKSNSSNQLIKSQIEQDTKNVREEITKLD